MKKSIMLMLVMLLTGAFAMAADTTLSVDSYFEGGKVTEITIQGDFAIVHRGAISDAWPIAQGASVVQNAAITSITIRNGEVIVVSGRTHLNTVLWVIAGILLVVGVFTGFGALCESSKALGFITIVVWIIGAVLLALAKCTQ